MKKINIRITSLIDGDPWLFSGEGTKSEINGKTILDATEYIGEDKIIHHIEVSADKVKITRLAEGATHLEFFKDKKGDVTVTTQYGNFSGKTITKLFAVKETALGNYITLKYRTDFDADSAPDKKVQITYSEI